jgi:hypothetical protein
MQDIKRFASNLNGLAEILGAELSELKLSFYERALSHFSDDHIEMAVTVAAQTMEFFPKPVQLIEIIQGKSQERALIAWDQLIASVQRYGSYHSVIFGDGKIAKAVELMGGWVHVCGMREDETKICMPQFLKTYQGLRGEFPQKKLIGRTEQDNAMRGFWDWIPEPIMIGAIDTDQLEPLQLQAV